MVVLAVPAVGYAVGQRLHIEIESLVQAETGLKSQTAHEAAGAFVERLIVAHTGNESGVEEAFGVLPAEQGAQVEQSEAFGVLPAEQGAQVEQSVHRSGTVIEAVGGSVVPVFSSSAPAADGQTGPQRGIEILADCNLSRWRYQFADAGISQRIGCSQLSLDEPVVLALLCMRTHAHAKHQDYKNYIHCFHKRFFD